MGGKEKLGGTGIGKAVFRRYCMKMSISPKKRNREEEKIQFFILIQELVYV